MRVQRIPEVTYGVVDVPGVIKDNYVGGVIVEGAMRFEIPDCVPPHPAAFMILKSKQTDNGKMPKQRFD